MGKSFEAMQRCISRDAELMAKETGYSAIAVRKFKCDPEQSGARNPLDALLQMIQAALRTGRAPEDALAPLYYLCDELSLTRPVPLGVVFTTVPDLSRAHNRLFMEFGHLQTEHWRAVEDGELSPLERVAIEREADHVEAHLHMYRAGVRSISEQ